MKCLVLSRNRRFTTSVKRFVLLIFGFFVCFSVCLFVFIVSNAYVYVLVCFKPFVVE